MLKGGSTGSVISHHTGPRGRLTKIYDVLYSGHDEIARNTEAKINLNSPRMAAIYSQITYLREGFIASLSSYKFVRRWPSAIRKRGPKGEVCLRHTCEMLQ